MRLRRLADRHDVGRHVARHGGIVGDERVRADLAELVHRGQPAHDHVIADLDVAAERRDVRHHAVITDHAVVRHVRVRHEQVVAADARHALVVRRAAVDGRELAEHVAVADLEPRRLALVLLVLRRIADRAELEDAVADADARRPGGDQRVFKEWWIEATPTTGRVRRNRSISQVPLTSAARPLQEVATDRFGNTLTRVLTSTDPDAPTDTIGVEGCFSQSWTGFDADQGGFITGYEAYKDPVLRTGNLNPEAYRDADSERLYLRFTPAAGQALAGTDVVAYLHRSGMDFLQHFLPGQPREENGQWSTGLMATHHAALAGGARLTAGLDLELARGYVRETQAGASGIASVPQPASRN